MEDVLPPKASVQDIKNNIISRGDFNREINSLKRFMEKGMENMITTKSGVRTTKYQLNELNIKKRTINQRRAKIIQEKGVSTYTGTMGSIRSRNLQPLQTDFQKVSKEMWNQIVAKIDRQYMDKYYNEQDERYKQNYLRSLQENYEGLPGYKEFYDNVENMNASDVVDMYYADPNLQIEFNYPKDEEEAIQNLRFIYQSYANYMKKHDLKINYQGD